MKKHKEIQSNKKHLYITRCIYPNLLTEKIKDLIETEQYKFAWLCSIINQFSFDNRYKQASIHSNVFQDKIKNYKDYIRQLIEWNIIKIQLNGDKETYCVGDFTKCYSFTDTAKQNGMIMTNFFNRLPKTNTSKKQIKSKEIDTSNIFINYTFKQIKKTRHNYIMKTETKPETLTEQELEYYSKLGFGESYLKRLDTNNYRVKFGKKSRRLYHPLINMPKVTRDYVWFKHSPKVVTYDIKSCYPVLLTKYVSKDELEIYKSALDNDIYLTINDNDRDQCKIDFQMFINGMVKNIVYDWFKRYLPSTFLYIKTNYKTMALNLQQTESDIMINGMLGYCIKNGIENIITLHDGFMTDGLSPENEELLVQYIKAAVMKQCGYEPTLKRTERKEIK